MKPTSVARLHAALNELLVLGDEQRAKDALAAVRSDERDEASLAMAKLLTFLWAAGEAGVTVDKPDTRPEYSAVTVMFDVLAALGRAGIEVPEPRTVLRHNAITAAADMLRAFGVKQTTQEPSVEEPT